MSEATKMLQVKYGIHPKDDCGDLIKIGALVSELGSIVIDDVLFGGYRVNDDYNGTSLVRALSAAYNGMITDEFEINELLNEQ